MASMDDFRNLKQLNCKTYNQLSLLYISDKERQKHVEADSLINVKKLNKIRKGK